MITYQRPNRGWYRSGARFAGLKPQKMTFFNFCLGLGMGIFGQLYLPAGSFGTIAILDLVSYAIGPIILLLSFNRMGRNVKRTVLFAILWTVAAVFANMVNFVSVRYSLKSIAVVATSVTLMSVSYSILKRDARLYLLYMLGWAIGCWIGLYYLKPGTWLYQEYTRGDMAIAVLSEKEIYPIVAYALLFTCFFVPTYFVKKAPRILSIAGCFFAGFYLLFHGGSRSNFGICVAAGSLGLFVCYFKRFIRQLFRNKLVLLFAVLCAALMVFISYRYMAESGTLGEQEKSKYQHQFAESKLGEGGILGRGEYVETFFNFVHSPWGVGGTNMRHSVLSNSWNCEGLLGLVFWLYFFHQCFWFLKNKLIFAEVYSCYIGLTMINACWAAIGSPFGARNIYFTLMIFIALCQDNPFYGEGTVFNRNDRGIE